MPEEAAPLHAEDPQTLSGYRLVGRLGEGAQGVVFLGRDPAGDPVAVKVLHTRLAGDEEGGRRFLEEIAAARQVPGFGTARVLDAGTDGDRPYVVSEYVPGPSLQSLVGEQGPRSDGALERLAVGTAMALGAIHRAGVVHRDFKPANVLLGPDGPRVIDFGVARVPDSTATATGHVVGTPSYTAPEQLGRGTVGPPADVFAWAGTMVYAATGKPPFGDDSVAAVMTRVLQADPDLTDVPAALRDLLAACLVKDPDARPDMRQVRDRLLGRHGAAAETAAAASASAAPPDADAEAFPAGSDADPAVSATVADDGPAASPTVADADPSAVTRTRRGPVAPPPADVPPPSAAPPGDVTQEPSKRRRWPLPVAAAVVLAVLAGVGVWWLTGDEDAAGTAAPETFTTLSEGGCHMVPEALVRKLVPAPSADDSDQGPEHEATAFRSKCAWTRGDHSSPAWRNLTVNVVVELSVKDPDLTSGGPTDGVARARWDVDRDRDRFRKRSGHAKHDDGFTIYYGPVQKVTGLGDEALAFSHHDLANDSPSYDPQIVGIDVRVGNAVVYVEYSSGDQEGRRMIPTPQPMVRKRAETVARAVLDHLARCGECTR